MLNHPKCPVFEINGYLDIFNTHENMVFCMYSYNMILVYFILSVTSHINYIVARCLINVVYLTACCLYQVMMTLHFLNDVANDAESTQNSKTTS